MEILELATDLKGARDEINRLRADYALLADDYMQLLGDVERLRAELAEWKQEWQTMETAPKDGSRILLATPSGKIADGFWSLEYRVWSWPYVMVEPTHWTRSLPIPGRKGEEEK